MYISCKVTSGTPLESETGYVPNNPLFGISLDSTQECLDSCVGCVSCQNVPSIPGIHTDDLDCDSCFDQNLTVLSSSQSNPQINLGNIWNSEDMTSSFPGLPPLDIDPLPSLFPFSPCGASYKYTKSTPSQDIADVLLSLKNVVLKSNPLSSECIQSSQNQIHHGQNSSFSAPQTSLSYTVHPQMLLSPNSHHFNQSQNIGNQNNHYMNTQSYYDTIPTNHQLCGGQTTTSLQPSSTTTPNAPIYPSMSVNVSMNMTMHGYPPSDNTVPLQCSQWPPNSSSSVNVLYPQLLSPTHYPNGATYSFTADFRPPGNGPTSNNVPITNSQQMNINHSYHDQNKMSPVLSQRSYHQHNIEQVSPKSPTFIEDANSKHLNIGFDEDEESNDGSESNSKPNLCRLCGKSYARPSTLKTHLRTHSGERPYRCDQCNKSFSQAANLTAHVRTHTGQKPFRCLICDRRFSQSSSVTTHMRTHSGERPYRCRSCKKAFSDSSTLTKHLRIHSGEKPYQCKLCYLRFSQSGNLNRHMRVHGTNVNLLS